VDIDGAVDMASTLQVDGAITSSAGATITVADNSDVLTLVSTDADASVGPNLNLYRNSGSPADNDALGKIVFNGRNDNSQDVTYGLMEAYLLDASDGTEDGEITIRSMVGGTSTNRLDILPTETVFNQSSVDLDFRVESDGNANMLFVDGGNDRVGIGRVPSISNSKLEVGGADNVSLINVEASGVTGGMGIGASGLQLFHGSSSKLAIASDGAATFSSSVRGTQLEAYKTNHGGDVSVAANQVGNAYENLASTASLILGATSTSTINSTKIVADHSGGATNNHVQDLVFYPVGGSSNNFEAMRISSLGALTVKNVANGHTVFNENGVDADFRVESDNLTHALFVEGSTGQLRVNTANWPTNTFGDAAGRHIVGGSNEPLFVLWNEASAAANNISTLAIGAKSATATTAFGGGWIRGGLENNSDSDGFLGFYTTKDAGANAEQLRISSSGAATFSSSITIPDWVYHSGDSNTYFGFPSGDEFKVVTANVGRLHIKGSESVWNEGGANVDFRVESVSNANALFVDASENRVFAGGLSSGSVGTAQFIVNSGQIGGSVNDTLRLQQWYYGTGNGSFFGHKARRTDANGVWTGVVVDTVLEVDNSADLYKYITYGIPNITVNEDGNDMDFRVESSGNANMLHVDGGNNGVGIGTTGTTTPLTVNGGTASAATIQLGNHGDNASIHAKYNLQFKADSTETISDRNDSGANIDFRVESDSNSSAFFVDAAEDNVLMGRTSAQSYENTASEINVEATGSFSTSAVVKTGVGTTYVDSGWTFGNSRQVWLITLVGNNSTSNAHSTVAYIATVGAWNKTLVQLGNASDHFDNGYLSAQLDSGSAATVNLQVRWNSLYAGGTSDVTVQGLRLL